MSFSPMLAIDASDHLNTIKYPTYASYKLDGIRAIFHPKLGLVSRALKPIPNKQLQNKFSFMIEKAKTMNRIFDGEFYALKLTFQEITRAVMTKDFRDSKTLTKLISKAASQKMPVISYCRNLIDSIHFYCFDCFDCLSLSIEENFYIRKIIYERELETKPYVICIKQRLVNSKEAVEDLFEEALKDGYEGLILRPADSPYKFGRSTLKEEYLLKVKPFKTFDAHIIEVMQATEVDPYAEKKTNELGRSVTSRKKGDRILIEKASAFKVRYGEHEVKVSLAMTDLQKEYVWKNKESYISRMIEYKGMLIGAKDVPRHPIFIRFRDDR